MKVYLRAPADAAASMLMMTTVQLHSCIYLKIKGRPLIRQNSERLTFCRQTLLAHHRIEIEMMMKKGLDRSRSRERSEVRFGEEYAQMDGGKLYAPQSGVELTEQHALVESVPAPIPAIRP